MKINRLLKISVSLVASLAVFSCSNQFEVNNAVEKAPSATVPVVSTQKGSAKVGIFVPNGFSTESGNARVVAPQTVSAKLSYKSNGVWSDRTPVDLSTASKTAVENGPQGLTGNLYEILFQGIPSGTYAAGELKVELLDSSSEVISTGSNTVSVTVSFNTDTPAEFHTIPVNVDGKESSLSAGEMKFWKINPERGDAYKIAVEVTGDAYPTLVLYDKNGDFVKFAAVSADSNVLNLDTLSETSIFYIGVWAPSQAVESYKLSIAYAPTDLSSGFGDSSAFSADWTTTGTTASKPVLAADSGVDGEGYAVYFNFKNLRTGKASLSRQIAVDKDSIISFEVKTDIYDQYDGTLNFYIDDVLQDSYTGTDGSWTKYSYEISAGKHTLKWEAAGSSSSYTTGITNSVYLDGLTVLPAPDYPKTLSIDFSNELDEFLFSGSGLSYAVLDRDEMLAKWVQYGDALVDTHGAVYKLSTFDSDARRTGDSAFTISKVTPAVDSALSFDYKCDLYEDDYLRVYVDGELKFEDTGSQNTWKKGTVLIPAGSHKIKFAAEKTDGRYSVTYSNTVLLDNISLVADEMAKVDIYPKGLQETYIGGDEIQFTAKALRSDGSVIEGKTVSWTTTGGSISAAGVFTPGTSAGTYTVTATIDGESVSNSTVKVHSENYLSDPVTINGNTFTGYSGSTSGTRTSGTYTVTWESPTPTGTSFSADGFFVVKGSVKAVTAGGKDWTSTAMMKITKGGKETTVFLKDDFYERVWLRFGPGDYTVTVQDTQITYENPGDGYDGDMKSIGHVNTGDTFTVTNTNESLTADEAKYLMPSAWCQLDDFIVSNAVTAVISELPEDATVGQKLAALHDWEVRRMHYDDDSLSYRKAQDAKHVVKYGMGVCEGYANLFTALERSIGVPGRVICAQYNNHGWNNTLYNGSWFLVDPTWDDPIIGSYYTDSGEKHPFDEDYTYFLLTKEQDSATRQSHGSFAIYETTTNAIGGDGVNIGRSVCVEAPSQPYVRGLPDGWY